MHTLSLTFSLLLLLLLTLSSNPSTAIRVLLPTKQPFNTTFIRTSCNITTYPTLCFTSLLSYAPLIRTSHMQLAHAALNVTLSGARNASAAMRAMSATGGMSHLVAAAMGDCMETFGDSVDQLKQSADQMDHMGGPQLGFQLSNVQTWMSAALTDEETCMEGFDEGGRAMDGVVKVKVRGYVLNVGQLTSNALVFVNSLANAAKSRSAP